MANDYKTTQSNLHISDDVIATVARCATKEIEGVDSLVANNYNWRQIFRARTPKAIVVDMLDGAAYIDITIIVKYGCKITEVAVRIQNAVKAAVQTMTGIRVARVDVHIADIAFDANNG